MSFLLLLKKKCCCCCGPGTGVGLGTSAAAAIAPFTSEETAILLQVGKSTFADTRRLCSDFFPTLLSGEFADPLIGGRPTITAKIDAMTPEELLASNETLCARIAPPPPTGPIPASPRPPEPIFPGASPYRVLSARGPAAIRNTFGLGSHPTLFEAKRNRLIFLKNNPGFTARITFEGRVVVAESEN